MSNITFIRPKVGTFGDAISYPPVPASKEVPSWFKKLPASMGAAKDGDNFFSSTIKKCVPVLDAITAGYILYTWHDIHLCDAQDLANSVLHAPVDAGLGGTVIQGHGVEQFNGAPFQKKTDGDMAFKYINAWGICTDPGYSCFIQTPSYSDTPIKILPGVVDTDSYHLPHFPFVFDVPEGVDELFIPAGTPVAQVIPFKREAYNMSIADPDKEYNRKQTRLVSYLKEGYRRFAHSRKSYR